MQDAAANIARIDPAQCRLPPNRLPITRADVEHLAASISAHGQLVPGLVRRTQPGDPIRYEILDNLCGPGKGCNDATLSTTAMNSPSHAQAA